MTDKKPVKAQAVKNINSLSLDELKIAAYDVNDIIQEKTAVLNAIIKRIEILKSE